jgi:hypothetical protein
VAYLDDGTMVVVDQAKKALGKTIEVSVTSVLQTTAGKMIFCRWLDVPASEEAPRRDQRVGDRRDPRNVRDYRMPDQRVGDRRLSEDRGNGGERATVSAAAAPSSVTTITPIAPSVEHRERSQAELGTTPTAIPGDGGAGASAHPGHAAKGD